ncbi:MAG: aspartate carbamoyltransferase catalytic subunit [Planctomycetota bacterium]|nr:aspartate carbamoyltransferase catalytic subunit [Planctomycetota bacterium]
MRPQPGPSADLVRSLLALAETDAARIRRLLARARELRPAALGQAPPLDLLQGKTVATAFFEPSTRTRTSFALAAQRMGAAVADLSIGGSSLAKGESVRDTALTLQAMGVHAIVVRGKQSGIAQLVHDTVACTVINAGDGRHEHPTQGLLDLATIAEAFGRDDSFDLAGLRVAIVGDVVSSRVARSAIAGLTKLGASVVLVGPPRLAPKGLTCLRPPDAPDAATLAVEHDLDMVLPEMDAVMMLRIQFERHSSETPGHGNALPPERGQNKIGPIASVRAYREHCGLTAERAANMKPGAVVLHPGPMNRSVEIDSTVADSNAGPKSLILQQVAWGVAVRAAVLAEYMGA